MKNWSVDEKHLKKYPAQYREWKLTQQINYGLDEGEKIDRRQLVKSWAKISPRLDSNRREFIKYLLWG